MIVAVTNLLVQVTEPSGPTSREQLVGQSVVPAALGNIILVEFANFAILISPCLWNESAVCDLLEYGLVVAKLEGMAIMK